MKTLVNDLEEKAVDLVLTYQTTSSSGQPFLDMGLGYVLFARNEKNLFRFVSFSLAMNLISSDEDFIINSIHDSGRFVIEGEMNRE